jgi:hypothetical protein
MGRSMMEFLVFWSTRVGDFLKLGDKGIAKICALGDESPVLGVALRWDTDFSRFGAQFQMGQFCAKRRKYAVRLKNVVW